MDRRRQDQLISEADARCLMAARRVLVEIGRRTSSTAAEEPGLSWRVGLLYQAASTAEGMIFEALSTASSMLDVPAARAACKENIYR